MARKELSDKAKETARQYDNIHYSVIGSKLTREKADTFRQLCKSSGVSVSGALSQFVQACILQGRIIEFSQDMNNGKSCLNFQEDGQEMPENDTPGTVAGSDLPSK